MYVGGKWCLTGMCVCGREVVFNRYVCMWAGSGVLTGMCVCGRESFMLVAMGLKRYLCFVDLDVSIEISYQCECECDVST